MDTAGENGTEILKPILGNEVVKMDAKGRVLLPKKMRERLGNDFALAIGRLGCLEAIPKETWNRKIREINSADPLNPGRDSYSRMLFSNSDDDLNCDEQGRMLVPSGLREKAELGTSAELVLVGCGDHLEIWASAEWRHFEKDPEVYGRHRREAMDGALRRMREGV